MVLNADHRPSTKNATATNAEITETTSRVETSMAIDFLHNAGGVVHDLKA